MCDWIDIDTWDVLNTKKILLKYVKRWKTNPTFFFLSNLWDWGNSQKGGSLSQVVTCIDLEKINGNGKGEEITLQKVTHQTTRSGDIINPNKKRARSCINLKISVLSVVCMVIGFTLVAR